MIDCEQEFDEKDSKGGLQDDVAPQTSTLTATSIAVVEPRASGMPTVQFSSHLHLCNQDEGTLFIPIVRIGNKSGCARVAYATRDGTACYGRNFIYAQGSVAFEAGEQDKEIEIQILQTSKLGEVVEFFVDLQIDDPVEAGAQLAKNGQTAKVEIIDTSSFPSDKYADLINQGDLERIPMWGLLFEYIKMNFLDPKIKWYTVKALLVGVFHNLHYLSNLFLRMYLIDYLLQSKDDNDTMETASKDAMLLVAVVAKLVPFAIGHFLDYSVLCYRIGGKSRSMLQTCLMHRFLNLSETVRQDLDHGALIIAMIHDVTDLVSSCYLTIFKCARSAGELMMVLVFQLAYPVIRGHSPPWYRIVPLVALMLISTSFMILRTRFITWVEFNRKQQQTALLGFVSFIVKQSRIIADYNRRTPCIADYEAHVAAYNGADMLKLQVVLNNSYFCPWVALVCIGIYMYIGGEMLISGAGGITLGLFLANIAIMETIGKESSTIFEALLEMQASIDSLQHITHLMNLPTDLEERRLANAERRIKTLEMKKHLIDQYPAAKNLLDLQPIVLEDIEFSYKLADPGLSRVNLQGKITLHQGLLTAFLGPPGEGKSTLLSILGNVLLPSGGLCFIPSHLRVLRVTAETQFYRGTLLDNLTFGVDKTDPDNSLAFVKGILERLGVTQRLLHYIDGDQEMTWAEILSQTECQILNLTRAFVFNPELLCIDRPFSIFDEDRSANVLELLREFVTKKGVEQNSETASMRRPRTCVFATDKITGLEAVDRIFKITLADGIHDFDRSEDGEVAVHHTF